MKLRKKKTFNITKYMSKYKIWIFLYVLLTLTASICNIFTVLFTAKTIELITLTNYKRAIMLSFIIIGISIFQRLCWYLSNVIYFKYSNKIMSDMNLDLAKQAFKLNSKTYNDHDTGTFVQRIVEDPVQIVDKLSGLVDMIVELVTSLIMLVYIMVLNVWISLALIALAIVAGIIEFRRVKVRRKNHTITRKKNDLVHSLTTEIVRSEKDIKSLGLEQELSVVSKKYYEDYRNHRYKLDNTDMHFWTIRNFIIAIGVSFTLILGIHLMDMGLLTLSAFMIVYSNKDSLWRVVYNGGNIANTLVTIKVCAKRMQALFDEKEFVTEKFGDVSLENVIGKIEFKNVSYTFKEYEYEDIDPRDYIDKASRQKLKANNYTPKQKIVSENKIFDNLSFVIKPNTTVAFVGKSGSGKSTILNLISKMYEADSGEILIDGVDIKSLDKNTLRSAISLVNQFPYIFDMTIKENLLLAKPDATDEEIVEAIKKASLNEFVESLPKGIDTKVGESGIKLSGGQKQRLAIARAMLRHSSIIIFDESTSSLDNFAQEDVKKSIDGLKGKSTIIIVAHRLSTIKDVDKIYFLGNGQILDSGTFDELFERNQTFKTMFLTENI